MVMSMCPRFWPTLYTVDECMPWSGHVELPLTDGVLITSTSSALRFFSSHPDSLINGRLEAQIDSNNSFPLYRSDDWQLAIYIHSILSSVQHHSREYLLCNTVQQTVVVNYQTSFVTLSQYNTKSRLNLRYATSGEWNVTDDKIRYDTRCYFNIRSKADIGAGLSQLNLPHGTRNKKKVDKGKLKSKKTDMLRSIGKQSGESGESVLTVGDVSLTTKTKL